MGGAIACLFVPNKIPVYKPQMIQSWLAWVFHIWSALDLCNPVNIAIMLALFIMNNDYSLTLHSAMNAPSWHLLISCRSCCCWIKEKSGRGLYVSFVPCVFCDFSVWLGIIIMQWTLPPWKLLLTLAHALIGYSVMRFSSGRIFFHKCMILVFTNGGNIILK